MLTPNEQKQFEEFATLNKTVRYADHWHIRILEAEKFITSLLEARERELVSKVEGLKIKELDWEFTKGNIERSAHNKALDAVKDIIQHNQKE